MHGVLSYYEGDRRKRRAEREIELREVRKHALGGGGSGVHS